MVPSYRITVFTLILAVVAAACGGESASTTVASGASDGPASTTAEASPTPQETATTIAQTPDADEPAADVSESMATVSIDGVEYTFVEDGPAALCEPDNFGGFWALLYSPDLADQFSVTLWAEGTGDGQQITTAFMKVTTDGEVLDLEASPEKSYPAAEAGTGHVESFTYEGNRASGTIQFVNAEVAWDGSLAPLDPIVADFDIVCAGD